MSLYEDFDGYFEHDYLFGLPGDTWKSKHGDITKSCGVNQSEVRKRLNSV